MWFVQHVSLYHFNVLFAIAYFIDPEKKLLKKQPNVKHSYVRNYVFKILIVEVQDLLLDLQVARIIEDGALFYYIR